MKRLGVFACIAILFVGLFTSFSYAQSAPLSRAQLLQKGTAIFDNFKATLQSHIANPRQVSQLKNVSDAQIATYTKAAQDLLQGIENSKQVFVSTFNTPAAASIQDYADYSAALYRAKDKLNEFQRTYPSNAAKFEVDNLSKQLDTAAQERQDELKAAGKSDEALNLQNAVGTQTTEQAKKDLKEGKCTSLWTSSIVDCIDAGVTWFIKNTFLQIGGFLVWLTANMLNFAIQVSILDFKSWAPDSLYPIWLVIRQIVSLAVVFAGLWLGFMYIIGREDTFARYVGWLVIFALFVNFSYPITRALTDISNIVSLNVYTSTVGNEALTTNFSTAATTLGGNTPGSLIMNRLGLNGLVGSATDVGNKQSSAVAGVNTTPGALIAVAFVFYAAYIFFMATAIIAVRTAVLVFLIVASPLLLVDSVVPKLGDAAMKMRKMFFEQLVVAPVFMIMLALTLKFMEIFGAGSGPLASAGGQGGQAALAAGTGANIQVFFSILMMLIMLHIMIKVTKHLAGEVGAFATNAMGKVGGFGLGVATAGTGFLARGTIGQLAARAGASQTMDRWKNTAIGRGVYGLTNSLANSTFDARNIGMVQRGMASAGLTGGLGITMQKGGARGFVDEQQAREKKVLEFGSNIRDDATRASYFRNANKGFVYAKVDEAKIRETEREVKEKKEAQISALLSESDPEKRKSIIDKALIAKDYALADKLRTGEEFHGIDNNDPEAAKKKADILKKMGIDNAKFAQELIKKDPFKDIADAHDKLVKQLKEDADKINRKTPEGEAAYRDMQAKIGEANAEFRQKKDKLIKETFEAYTGVSLGAGDVDIPLPLDGSRATIDPEHPGGSDMSGTANVVPAIQRRVVEGSEARELTPEELQKMNTGFDIRTRSAVDIARMSRNRGNAANSAQGPSSASSNSTTPAATA